MTQRQWRLLMANNPSKRTYGIGPELPVTNITWFEALEFLNRLSLREKRSPCYTKVGDRWLWECSADGYRLPTEAEWEYAARAGTTTAYSFGNDPTQLPAHAWFNANSKHELSPVGRLDPNPWRLFDMHGLVYEWTWRLSDNLVTQATVDPSKPTLPVSDRVLRGGSFVDMPKFLRSAYRERAEPSSRKAYYGLRCVRGAHPQP